MRQVPLLELPVDPDERGDPMERIADPRGYALEQIWDEEWRLNLLDVVLERVKTEVSERQFQIFHCHVVKEWSVREVCRALNVSAAQVYLAKHRVGVIFAQEMEEAKRLANEPGGIN